MSNSRTYKLNSGDVLWFCDYDPTIDSGIDFGKPASEMEWLNKNAFEECCKKAITPPPHYVYVTGKPGDNKLIYSGVCGTKLVARSTYFEKGYVAFEEWRNSRISEDWNQFIDSLTAEESHFLFSNPVGPPATSLWEGFDSELISKTSAKNVIEFGFVPKEKHFCVHFELGDDEVFIARFRRNIRVDKQGFITWLTTPDKLDRICWLMTGKTPTDITAELPCSSISIAKPAGGLPQVLQFDTECPSNCKLIKSCSMVIGNVSTLDVLNGTATVDLEAIAFKPYCADSSGNPCPG